MSLTLYLEATTTIPDLFIDYIEVRLASGESASLNWDESEIYRNPDGFGAKYKGVYFGEEPANGRLDELHDMVITDIGLYDFRFLSHSLQPYSRMAAFPECLDSEFRL